MREEKSPEGVITFSGKEWIEINKDFLEEGLLQQALGEEWDSTEHRKLEGDRERWVMQASEGFEQIAVTLGSGSSYPYGISLLPRSAC